MALGSEEINRMRAPTKVEDLGVPVGLVEDLFMRRVLTERVTTIGETAELLCIAHSVANEMAASLREKALVEYLGADGRDYRIQLTELGHRTTTQRMTAGRHVGSVPVPVEHYRAVVEEQHHDVVVDHAMIKNAFHDMVLDDDVLDQIGPAFVSGGAIFLYGPAGTGKTSIAERLNRVFTDPVLIPRYLETDGQVISVYDPSLHVAVPDQPAQLDPRWVLCERPLILVGGELDMTMLDLQHDRISGINAAPIQVLANNGILVVDDFGRQAIRPEEILNRWIVPLSRGIDYLKANTGTKFTVPFQLKLVISTNLDPNSLGDDAFLRRLRNKVFIGPVSEPAFVQILDDVADRLGINLTESAIDYLCDTAMAQIGELRPYLAVDFCDLAVAVSDYEHSHRRLDEAMIDRVTDLYFVQGEAQEMSGRQLDMWQLGSERALVEKRNGLPAHLTDYEIGGGDDDDLLAGLDALAATQSIDNDETDGAVPAALRSIDGP